MPTAKGFVFSIVDGAMFTSTFMVEHRRYCLTGSIYPPVVDFKATDVTLTYTNIAQLRSQCTYEGQIGPRELSIESTDGALQIHGPLDMPINLTTDLSGSGGWMTRVTAHNAPSVALLQAALDAQKLDLEVLQKERDAMRKELDTQKLEVELLQKERETTRKEVDAQRLEVERQKKEREAMRKEVETQRLEVERETKEHEVMRREVETQRLEVERQMKEREAMRKEVETERLEVERQKKEREAMRKELNERQLEVGGQTKEREAMRKELDAQKLVVESRTKERDAARKELETERLEVERQKKEREAMRKELDAQKLAVESRTKERERQSLTGYFFDVQSTPLYLINKKFKTALEWGDSGSAEGNVMSGATDQQWVFERVGSGYSIACVRRNTSNGTSYLKVQQDGQLVLRANGSQTLWAVQPAGSNTFRIAKIDESMQCAELSGEKNGSSLVLASFNADAAQQLWEFMPVLTQTLDVPTTPFHVVNKKFQTVLEWGDSGSAEGKVMSGATDQQWVFERVGSGYSIACVRRTKSDQKVYLKVSPNGPLVLKAEASQSLWAVQPAGWNTFRIAMLDKPMRCAELSGEKDGSSIALALYNADATQQLWEFKPLLPQTLDVPATPFLVVNKKYNTVLEWGGSGNAEGHVLHGATDQQWAFERAGSGYTIACVMRNTSDRTVYLRVQEDGPLVLRADGSQTLWAVQPAGWNTFRIAKVDDPTRCAELSGENDGSTIILASHSSDATQQLWELKPLLPQILDLSTTPFHVINKRFKMALEWGDSGNAEGHVRSGATDQQWVFERVGSGYSIACVRRTKSDQKVYLKVSPNGPLVLKAEASQSLWAVQPAGWNTFRIAMLDKPMRCAELSGEKDGSPIALASYNADASQQLWEFAPVAIN